MKTPTFIILFLFSFSFFSSEKMVSLSGHPAKALSEFSKKTLFLFFQKDCSACQAQVKELKCLDKKFDINLLGSISEIEELKKEYKNFNVKYPAYFADPIAMAKLPIKIPATPQLILWSKPKPKLFIGYKPCKTYAQLIK